MDYISSGGFPTRTTITLPAVAAAYAAGDVVGGAFEIQNVSIFPGRDIVVNVAALMPCIAAIPAGMSSFRLPLYDANPASAIADNAQWTLPAGDRANYLGYIDLGSPADFGPTLYCQVTQVGLQARLAAGRTSLWGYLVTNGAYTPAAGSEEYVLALRSFGV